MSDKIELGFPNDAERQKKALIIAGVVLIIAVTPTLFDAYDAWMDHPTTRPVLIGWYLFAAFVALSTWQVLGGS